MNGRKKACLSIVQDYHQKSSNTGFLSFMPFSIHFCHPRVCPSPPLDNSYVLLWLDQNCHTRVLESYKGTLRLTWSLLCGKSIIVLYAQLFTADYEYHNVLCIPQLKIWINAQGIFWVWIEATTWRVVVFHIVRVCVCLSTIGKWFSDLLHLPSLIFVWQ